MTSADTTHTADAAHSGENHEGNAHHHEKSRWDDINVSSIVVSGFVSAVLTYATIVGCQAFYYYCENLELYTKEIEVRQTPQTAIIEKQKRLLDDYAKTDEGTILIPIDRAMQLTLSEYEK